jgi:hypothetical protein
VARIVSWAEDASSPAIFWLSGLAGMGKSTIAYTICQMFDNADPLSRARLCASFFCSRQVADLRRRGNIIPTLAYQLAHLSSSFAKGLDSVDSQTVHVSSEQMEKLLVSPWVRAATDRPDGLPLSLIVIDALDEIDDDGGEKLLKELIEATTRAKGGMRGLKILVTSRPHPMIVASSSPLSRDFVYRLEDIKEGYEDVRKHLAKELPDLETLCTQRLDELSALANGLFIFAATVVRLVCPPTYRLSPMEQEERLSDILNGHVLTSSGSESGIDVLYRQIVRAAVPLEHGASRLAILHNIICALQALTPSVHAELVAPTSDRKDETAVKLFVETLYAVLYIRDGRVYTHHKSFSDFMLSSQRCEPSLTCVPEVQHVLISLGCIRIMEASLRFNICNLPSSFLFDSEVENLNYLIDANIRKKADLEYACRYWALHVIEVPPTSDKAQDLRAALAGFSEEKILFWIEVMNLLSAKDACYDGVNAVMAWVKNAVSNSLAITILFPDVRRRTGNGRIRRNRAADGDERPFETRQIIPTHSNVAVDTSSLHHRSGDGTCHKSPNPQLVAVSLPQRSPSMLRWCEQPWRGPSACQRWGLYSLSCVFPRWQTRRLGLEWQLRAHLGCVDRGGDVQAGRTHGLCQLCRLLAQRQAHRLGLGRHICAHLGCVYWGGVAPPSRLVSIYVGAAAFAAATKYIHSLHHFI